MTSLLAEVLQGEPLTERETEILAAAAEGETAAQTGARLYLSSETVKGYRKRIIAKPGVGRQRRLDLVEGCLETDPGRPRLVAELVVHGAHGDVRVLRRGHQLAKAVP